MGEQTERRGGEREVTYGIGSTVKEEKRANGPNGSFIEEGKSRLFQKLLCPLDMYRKKHSELESSSLINFYTQLKIQYIPLKV